MKNSCTDRTNADKAAHVEDLVTQYERRVGVQDMETLLSDLVADIMHYARQQDEDPNVVIDRATCYFEEEATWSST